MRIAPLLLLALCACADWPRYANLPDDPTAGRLVAGTEVGGPIEVAWTDLSASEEPGDDDPRELPSLALEDGEGSLLVSSLVGTGWNYTDTSPRVEDCGHVSAFPTSDHGYYLGDVDWRVIEAPVGSTLCSGFYADTGGSQVDVVPFHVDECGLPTEPIRDPGSTGESGVVGFGVNGAANTWSIEVDGDGRYALVAAGWAPDDAARVVDYHWGVAVLSAEATSGEDWECPVPPGAVVGAGS